MGFARVSTAAVGQTEPPSFVPVMAELAQKAVLAAGSRAAQSLNTRYLHGCERPDGKLVEVRLYPADCGAYTGHQMVYVGLDSGSEYLFIGDVAWMPANVTQLKLRPAVTMRRINADASALGYQLRWIKQIMDQEKLIVIPSHDDALLQDLGAKQLVGAQLMLR
jgi:hypothetical protein